MPCNPIIDQKTGKVKGFICSRRQKPKCAICSRPADYYCDFALEDGHTCDMPLCTAHHTKGGRDVDYCPEHAKVMMGEQETIEGLWDEKPNEDKKICGFCRYFKGGVFSDMGYCAKHHGNVWVRNCCDDFVKWVDDGEEA